MTHFLKKFQQKKILVIGDVVLDHYIKGDVDRISPEAPVPVMVERSRKHILGGAGNVARNAAALGGGVTLAGIVGRDPEGRVVQMLCREEGILPRLVFDGERPTSVKTRAVARRHQLLRIDREIVGAHGPRIEREFIAALKKLPSPDLVVISDYAKGSLTKNVIQAIFRRFGRENVIVDLKPANAGWYEGVRAITPNLKEALELTGIYGDTNERASRAAKRLSEKLQASVILTRGEHGITVYDKEEKHLRHVPSRALDIFDVTGAGDTVIAALALGLASGASLGEAAELANYAAGVVVGMEGTAAISRKELYRRWLHDHTQPA